MDLQLIAAIVFLALLALTLYFERKKLAIQKILLTIIIKKSTKLGGSIGEQVHIL